MNSLVFSMITPQLTHFDQCMEILKEIESNNNITSMDLFHISRAIMKESEHYTTLFFNLPAKLRLKWFRDENILNLA